MSDLQAERYRQAKAIVHAASDRPVPERAAFVDGLCGDDEELRKEARWLLQAAQDEEDRFLEHDALQQGDLDDDTVVQSASPRDYRIVRRLGEGGHGVVFLAERSGDQFHHLVALKLLNFAGRMSPQARARFLAERQILAKLNHPNIAHLIDAGALPDGRPFLAMEYVDGVSLTEHCSRRGLDVEQRVRLFLKVCAAVAHAHQQLIIHRDLKPANILMTAEGEPKLLDFGIARLLLPQEGIALPATRVGLQLLTLRYASPEQIRGEPLSTASDVYSLGVLLFELLAGSPPFGEERDEGDAIRLSRSICEAEPSAPSRHRSRGGAAGHAASNGRRIGRWRLPVRCRPISPDLDAIALKALCKRPEQRYGSVYALVEDLERYLSRRPVLARRGRMAYRARRFIQRNRLAVAAAAGFAVLTVGFAVNRQFELARTQLERDKAQQLADFMSDLFRNADPSRSQGATITVRELLDKGARDVMARTGLDPRLKSSMMLSIGSAYTSLGLAAKATPVLTAASNLETGPAERASVLMELAEAYSSAGKYSQSIARDEQALRLLRADGGMHEEQLMRARLNIINSRVQMADSPLPPLIADLQAAMASLQRRPAPNANLLLAYQTLGSAYKADGRIDQALSLLAKAVDLSIRLYGADTPDTIAIRKRYAQAMVSVDPAKGAALLGALAADYVRIVDNRNTLFHAEVLNDMSVALGRAGKKEQSLAASRQAVATARAAAGTDDRIYLQLAGNLASMLLEQGHDGEAIALLRESLPSMARRTGTGFDRMIYAFSLNRLGTALEGRDGVEAERVLAQAEQVLGADVQPRYANIHLSTLYELTRARIALKHYAQAEESLARLKAAEARSAPPIGDLRSRILQVDLMLAHARYADAQRLSGESLALAAKSGNACSRYAGRLREQYLAALRKQGGGAAGVPSECTTTH